MITRISHSKSMGICSGAQGQLTLHSVVESGRFSNSSEIAWLSSLPAIMEKIRSKMKALDWSQVFPQYNPIGAICCHGNQSSDPMWPKTLCSLSHTLMMVLAKWSQRYSYLKVLGK